MGFFKVWCILKCLKGILNFCTDDIKKAGFAVTKTDNDYLLCGQSWM